MAIQGAAEVFKDREAVFAQGGEVAADARVAAGALQRAKAARDLEAHFHHAKGSLGLVVGEGQLPCPQEG